MKIDLVEIIWLADIILFSAIVILSAAVIIAAIIADERRFRRAFYLERLRRVMAVLAASGNEAISRTCPQIIEESTPEEFLDLALSRAELVPPQFDHDFHACLNASRKIADVERQAGSPVGHKWARIQALLAVGAVGSGKALDILRKALGDRDPDVAYYSMVGLSYLKTPEAARLLIGMFPAGRFSPQKIASLLGSFPPDSAQELLLATRSTDALVRFWGVRVLGSFKESRYLDEMVALSRDASADVRAAACMYLGRFIQPPARQALESRLGDEAWFVRLHAIRSLEVSLKAAAVPQAIVLLGDGNWFVREEAKRILSGYPQEAAGPVRQALSSGSASSQDCREVLRNLGAEE